MPGVIEYILEVSDDEIVKFNVDLDLSVDKFHARDKAEMPEWTHLQACQCEHCPLTPEQADLCPLAYRIMPFVDQLGHLDSIDKIRVTVNQADHSKQMIAPVQDILGSLLGLFIATSHCPHTYFLKPMAHFHLPLADPSETIYRVMSMYRLAQFFKKRAIDKAYAGFDELQGHYANMEEVNYQLSQRIRMALKARGNSNDGAINAIVVLDALSQYVPASIEDAIGELEPIFSDYWDEQNI